MLQENSKTMKHHLPKIEVKTLPNGYSMEYEGMKPSSGHLYFSADDLLKGFMVHIGLHITEQLNMETIDDFLDAVINWKDNKKCIAEIEKLQAKVTAANNSRSMLASRLVNEREKLLKIVKSISDMADDYKNLKDIRSKLLSITKNYVAMKPITLKSLGFSSNSIIENQDTEDDDEI